MVVLEALSIFAGGDNGVFDDAVGGGFRDGSAVLLFCDSLDHRDDRKEAYVWRSDFWMAVFGVHHLFDQRCAVVLSRYRRAILI